MTAPARLGILDWGIGGVGVWRGLRRRAPHLPVLYLSDSGYIPYGLLTRAALSARLFELVRYLAENGATGVVVACNAASTVLDDLTAQRGFDVPVLGTIAPALALVPASFRGTLAVLGGLRTVQSQVYRRGLQAPGRCIVQRVAQPLSAHIEAGRSHSRRCAQDLDRILAPVRDADALLLACTHYPAVSSLIATRVPSARLLDPAESLIEHALDNFPLPRKRAADRALTTGDVRRSRTAARLAWGLDWGPFARARLGYR